jgi:hypothetical protein
MFIQVIKGKIADADGLKAALQRWYDEVAPTATGWLGSTGGVTADGTAVAVVRFESAAAARRNSERPEQQRWWEQASASFAGDVEFHDCEQVLSFLDEGSDDAGFVQIIQGRVTDADRMLRLLEESAEPLRKLRPEIIGGTIALHGDGGFTQTVYFASETAAREGERKETPPEMKEMDEEVGAMMSDATFFDLPHPWLHSPR